MTLGDLQVGSVITDKKTKFNGKTIEWLVADRRDYILASGVKTQATLLLSEDILTCRPFNSSPDTEGTNLWKNSEIRDWLNHDFCDYVSSNLFDHIWSISLLTSGQRTDDTFFLLSFDEAGFGEPENALSIFKKDSRQRVAEACDNLPWHW